MFFSIFGIMIMKQLYAQILKTSTEARAIFSLLNNEKKKREYQTVTLFIHHVKSININMHD